VKHKKRENSYNRGKSLPPEQFVILCYIVSIHKVRTKVRSYFADSLDFSPSGLNPYGLVLFPAYSPDGHDSGLVPSGYLPKEARPLTVFRAALIRYRTGTSGGHD